MTEQAEPPETAVADDMAALEEALTLAGGPGALAKLIGRAASLPSMWRARGAVPKEAGPDIEFAVGGKVPAERLCPNERWVRIRDAAWPHPDGRPLLDTARFSEASEEARAA